MSSTSSHAVDEHPGPMSPLADVALAEEIELYADVVVAASESDGPLPEGELDRVLGVDEPPVPGGGTTTDGPPPHRAAPGLA